MAPRCKLLLVAALCLLTGQLPAAIMSGPIMRTIGGSSSSLNTSLIAYWKLDEFSDASAPVTRVDSESTGTAQDLTDNNTTASGTGILGNAADFEASNSEKLTRASSSDLQAGNISYAITLWCKIESLANRFIFSKDGATAGQREYIIYFNNALPRFQAYVFQATDVAVIATADNLGIPSVGVWYFIVMNVDASAKSVSISVNNGAVNTTTWTGDLQAASNGTFVIASHATLSNYWFDGLIDEAGFWKKVLSAAEITALYGGGTPPACCPFTVIP